MKYFCYGEQRNGETVGVVDRYDEKKDGPLEIIGPYALMWNGRLIAHADCVFTSLARCKTRCKEIYGTAFVLE